MNYRAEVRVTLKPGVFDPQGAATAKALATLGFGEVEDVRVGRYLELRLETPDEVAARERVAAMCERLLANPVIERYEFMLLIPDEEVA